MLLHFKPIYVSSFLLLVFSGIYLRVVKIPPIYVSFFAAVFFLILGLFLEAKISVSKSVLITCAYLIYLIISQTQYNKDSAYYNYLFSLVYFVLTYVSFNYIKFTEKIIKVFVVVSLGLLVADTWWRISNPIFKAGNIGNLAFYRFKYNSLMYQDSNYVGVFGLIILFFIFYLESVETKRLFILRMLFFVMIILTFSRAAIMVSVLFWFTFDNSIKKTIKTVLVFCLIILGGYLFSGYIMADDSYKSKLMIINRAVEYFRAANIQEKLFGIGLGHSVEKIGIGSHNFLVSILLETGIVGMALLAMIWAAVYKETRGKVKYVMFPFLLTGLSFVSHFVPYLYAVFAVMIVMENKRGITFKTTCTKLVNEGELP